MLESVLLLALLVALGGAAFAANTPVDRVEKPEPASAGPTAIADFFPGYDTAEDLQAYRVTGLGGAAFTVEGTDSCLKGDQWQTAIVSLPGPVLLDADVTSGVAPGCACSFSIPDITLNTRGRNTVFVAQRYRRGADVFPASSEIRMSSADAEFAVDQIRGMDVCCW